MKLLKTFEKFIDTLGDHKVYLNKKFPSRKDYEEKNNLSADDIKNIEIAKTVTVDDISFKVIKEDSMFCDLSVIVNGIEWKDKAPLLSVNKDICNRIDFDGLPLIYRGLGLGYKIYKALIFEKGYACSYQDASTRAQNVWSKLIKDRDFYSVVMNNTVLCISNKLNKEEIKLIIKKFLRINTDHNTNSPIIISPILMQDPEFKKIHDMFTSK